MTVADMIAAQLLGAGVRTIFGVPGGGGNLDLIAAAAKAGLPFVLTSTETAGAIAALAQAEVTGRVGSCLTTLGPGAASVVNGVACAYLDRAPIVVFTDSHAAGARSAFEHQRLDHAALLGPVTKSSASLTVDNALQAVTRALHIAADRRPGPVHLDCPGDVAGSTRTGGFEVAAFDREERMPALEDRSRFETLLGAARKPLLLVGLGARGPANAAAIRGLCAARDMPAMVTYKSKGVVADDDEWFAGVFTNAVIEQPILDESDLLIGIGLDPVELIPRAWTRRQPIVACNPWRVEDAHVPFAVQLIAPVAACVELIENALPPSDWDCCRVRDLVGAQTQRLNMAGGFTAQRVVTTAAERLAPIVRRVTVDAGAHMFPATVLWPVGEPNGMLISNGLSTMGFALPAAIGAALADRHGSGRRDPDLSEARDRHVVALTGDGGLLMCAGELLTATRERLPIITIVFSDASLSLIEIKQQARGLAPDGVALGAIDWPGLARSFGVDAWSAANDGELDRAIEAALATPGPSLIEAKIDRSNYGATLRAVRG
jgi:acetolactate synthase I/II/III large subunit